MLCNQKYLVHVHTYSHYMEQKEHYQTEQTSQDSRKTVVYIYVEETQTNQVEDDGTDEVNEEASFKSLYTLMSLFF